MVEYNGGDYATYLCNVFQDDADFQGAAKGWATEEVQHGQALARWAKLADDSFDFDRSFQRFRDGFKISTDAAGAWDWKTAYDARAAATVLFLRQFGPAQIGTAQCRASECPYV